jgi:hypothetical protein
VQPELVPLALSSATAGAQRVQLGAVASDEPMVVLLELIVEGAAGAQLAQIALHESGMVAQRQAVVTAFADEAGVLSPLILDAVARSNAARLQLRGLEAVAAGDRERGATLLRSAAERLRELGEHELAQKALDEAASVERTGQTSRLGAKELAYATRLLGGKNEV